MGKSSGSTQTTTSSSSTQPWSPTIKPLKDIIGRTMALGADRFTPSYSSQTMAGLQGMEDAATSGNSVGVAGQSYGQDVLGRGAPVGVDQLISTAQGNYLGPNQHLLASLGYATDDVANRINSQFSGLGRLGSGMNQRAMAEGVSRTAMDALAQNYATERGNQLSAANQLAGMGGQTAAMASQLDSGALMPSQLLMQVGGIRDDMANATKNADIAALDYQRSSMLPIAGLGNQSSGTSTTTMQGPKPSIGGQILGGAMMLGGLARGFGGFGMPSFGFNPFGGY